MTRPTPNPEPSAGRAEQAASAGALTIGSRREGDEHVVRLEGELDLAHAADFERELVRVEAGDARRIVVDLSGLTFIDSTGVRVMVQAQARSRADSNRLTLIRPPASVHRVFVVCGLERVLPFGD